VKLIHEIRDPIHTFVKLDDDERMVMDSRPVQRLRQIHQLAMSYLVYPGATHRRFEHSIGVMELAGRVFDVVTNQSNVVPRMQDLFGVDIGREDRRLYWRRVIRMAALCHDIGHLPFSHAAEHDLLPDGWDHERLSVELIKSPEMEETWRRMRPPLDSGDIVKLAVGQKKLPNEKFSDWEAILSEIIVGDALGVDRMDYLLRDSHHAGVAYGRFDHFRLIDTMRILPSAEGDGSEPQLGVEAGGLHSVEALLLARYFMFTQVYYHPVRRIYDIHLKDFLREFLAEGMFSTNINEHLEMTDTVVLSAMNEASKDATSRGYEAAWRVLRRQHFKLLWNLNPGDLALNSNPGKAIHEACVAKFGESKVRQDRWVQAGATIEFPVMLADMRVISAQAESDVLKHLPAAAVEFVFIDPDVEEPARRWLEQSREGILEVAGPREED
jgi:HD superfamily phosphohydrolase